MADIVQIKDPLYVNRALSAQEFRYGTTSLFQPTGTDPATTTTGVLPGRQVTATNPSDATAAGDGMLTVFQTNVPSMGVRVAKGYCLLSRPNQGVYLAANIALQSLTLDPADGSNPRIDLVVVQIVDTEIGDVIPPEVASGVAPGAMGCAVLRVVKGTPQSVPVAPTPTNNMVVLAEVRVNAGVSNITAANITMKRRGAGLRGATRIFLEGDDENAPGTYSGELRMRQNRPLEFWGPATITPDPADPPPSSGMEWHGTVPQNPLRIHEPLALGDMGPSGVPFLQAEHIVPDPGYPYYVLTMAAIRVGKASNPTSAASFQFQSEVERWSFSSPAFQGREAGSNFNLQTPKVANPTDFEIYNTDVITSSQPSALIRGPRRWRHYFTRWGGTAPSSATTRCNIVQQNYRFVVHIFPG